mgnify:CR=1 FL=1
MYPNLEAELKRKRIRRVDIAKNLGLAMSTVSEKMQGKSEFTMRMAYKIKDMIGEDIPLEVLFSKNPMRV